MAARGHPIDDGAEPARLHAFLQEAGNPPMRPGVPMTTRLGRRMSTWLAAGVGLGASASFTTSGDP